MANAKLQEPSTLIPPTGQHYLKEKPRRAPKYKILRKVMSCEDIPLFIQRVTHDLTYRRSHVLEMSLELWNLHMLPRIGARHNPTITMKLKKTS